MNRTIFRLYLNIFININKGYYIFTYKNRTHFHLNFHNVEMLDKYTWSGRVHNYF